MSRGYALVKATLNATVGLLAQASARLDWDAARGAFVPVDLPPHVQAVDEVTGESLVAAPFTPSKPSFNKRAFICLCSDVTSQDLREAISEGLTILNR